MSTPLPWWETPPMVTCPHCERPIPSWLNPDQHGHHLASVDGQPKHLGCTPTGSTEPRDIDHLFPSGTAPRLPSESGHE